MPLRANKAARDGRRQQDVEPQRPRVARVIGNPLNLTLAADPSPPLLREEASRARRASCPSPRNRKGEATRQPHALGFTAWFEEKIVEYSSKSRPYAITRFRKCIMTYFPEDASFGIEEPKIKNSGYMGGTYLKRSKCKLSRGEPSRRATSWWARTSTSTAKFLPLLMQTLPPEKLQKHLASSSPPRSTFPTTASPRSARQRASPNQDTTQTESVDHLAGMPPGTRDVLRCIAYKMIGRG